MAFEYEVVGDVYVLQQEYSINIDLPDFSAGQFCFLKDGIMTLRKGAGWNGSNVVNDRIESLRASLIHDYLCYAISIGRLNRIHRKEVDEIYLQLAKEDGLSWVKLNTRALGFAVHRLFI